MALDPSLKLAKALQWPSPTIATRHNLFAGLPNPNRVLLRPTLRSSALAFARRRSTSQSNTPCKKQHEQKLPDEDLGEDAFDALFKQLEEDLKNDGPSISEGEDDIAEEDVAQFEHELAEAAGEDELFGALNEIVGNAESGDDLEEYDEDSEEVTPVKLKNWQLRKLAYALKTGRRKTNIKSLAADVCLDRAVVLQLLRDPPPNLLMMSAALPDEPERTVVVSKTKPKEVADLQALKSALKAKTTAKAPVHVMQRQWSAQKRLKRVQVETLEIVYRRTQRPTNAMISSIVHVTNLPRKRVVKWFEDKRAEAGVPKQRLPFQGSTSETAEPVV